MEQLVALLKTLDVKNDNQWTVNGDPRLETLKFLNKGVAITRDEIEQAWPGFNRAALEASLAPPPPPAAPPPPPQNQPVAPPPPQAKTKEQDDEQQGTGEPGAAAEVAGQSSEGKDEIKALAEALDRADEAVNAQRVIVEEATEKMRMLQAERARISDRLHARNQDMPKTNVNMEYISAQNRQRELRGLQIRAIQESGVDLNALNAAFARSPLDESLKSRR